MIDRRRHKRIKALLEQEGVVLLRHETEILAARLADFSAEGALLKVSASMVGLRPGTIVSLWIDSGGTVLDVEALIVRSSPGYIGVQFLDLTPQECNEIQTKMIRMEIIASRLPKVGV